MLLSLRMMNFRRHVDTEVSFSPDEAQIIAITGPNGAGKSTILEAVTYALFGESRHGRRYMPLMVRRGAEDEGMQVELTFEVAGTEYYVQRRLDRRKSSATLMANGNVVMQAADAVTAEIRNILGMDAAGFQLAVTAKQNDVMALAGLQPARRRQTITRLLRQDVLTKARGAARDEKNRNLNAVRAFGESPDIDVLEEELSGIVEDIETTQAAATAGEETVAGYDAKLADASQVRERWHSAAVEQASAKAGLKAAQEHFGQATNQVNALQMAVDKPRQVLDPEVSVEDANERLSAARARIAAGEQSLRLLQIAQQLRAERDRLSAQEAGLRERIGNDTVETATELVTAEQEKAQTSDAEVEKLRSAVQTAQQRQAVATSELAAGRKRLADADGLAAVCDVCEQEITDEHKEAQHEKHSEYIARKEQEEATLTAKVAEVSDLLSKATKAGQASWNRVQVLQARVQELEGLFEQRKTAAARIKAIDAQLADSDVEPVDLDALRTEERQARQVRDSAVAFEKQERHFRDVSRQLEDAIEVLAGAKAGVEEAEREVALAEPDPELVREHAELKELENKREMERQMLSAIHTELVKSKERKQGVKRLIADAQRQLDRAAQVRAQADLAAKAAWLLDATAERMATEIRPALEGEISAILSRLSEGRFNSVVLSEDYDVAVFDDGEHRSLNELSGGEQVLVALATRLALAQVVAGRQPHGGLRLLVLDEVFGSQDAQRREAIMHALRALREDYGQILLISHVPGLEEVADRVLDVQLQEGEGVPVAELASL